MTLDPVDDAVPFSFTELRGGITTLRTHCSRYPDSLTAAEALYIVETMLHNTGCPHCPFTIADHPVPHEHF